MKRIDSTNYLYHWIKSQPYQKRQSLDYESAYKVFVIILWDEILKHGDPVKTGGEPCICFTESPEYFMHRDKSKYQPFGFKYSKKKIFERGGRAVVYSPDYEKNLMDSSMLWRYMRHDPLAITDRTPYGVDFTWEREWRLPSVEIEVLESLKIIVPNQEYFDLASSEMEDWVHASAQENGLWMGNSYGYPDPAIASYVESIQRLLSLPEEFE